MELPHVLTHRERDLLTPAVQRIQKARAEMEAAGLAFSVAVEMLFGRSDLTLSADTWTLSAEEPPPSEPAAPAESGARVEVLAAPPA